MEQSDVIPVFAYPSPKVRRIAFDQPWGWLQAGFRDMIDSWRVSLAYGALVTAFSWAFVLVLTGTGYLFLVIPMCAGFMLVAPLAAVGLYETSRRRALGETTTLGTALTAFRRNPRHIAFIGLALALLLLFWIRVATLLYALFFSEMTPTLDGLIPFVFDSPQGLAFLITGTLIGGVLALGVFAIGAVSIPMLLDREIDVLTAIATSMAAFRENFRPMLLWGFIICFCIGAGMLTLLIGLAVAYPLIGHATWHAYKDLVVDKE